MLINRTLMIIEIVHKNRRSDSIGIIWAFDKIY